MSVRYHSTILWDRDPHTDWSDAESFVVASVERIAKQKIEKSLANIGSTPFMLIKLFFEFVPSLLASGSRGEEGAVIRMLYFDFNGNSLRVSALDPKHVRELQKKAHAICAKSSGLAEAHFVYVLPSD